MYFIGIIVVFWRFNFILFNWFISRILLCSLSWV